MKKILLIVFPVAVLLIIIGVFLFPSSGPEEVGIGQVRLRDGGTPITDGNEDGRANPGETISLSMQLVNNTPFDVTNITAKISSEEDIELIRDKFSYLRIPFESHVWTFDPFIIKIPETIESSSEIDINVTITDDEGREWVDTYTLKIY